ncbi:hypothetical protein GOP47_0016891 [Adiantum capillus-veneris]|uniref:Uncharacterized protein n=1 Tax=Adiantum capillus-veneris TaxID=13818 RepID=A0A9D4ZDE8_ADICA|nr:hypothetical protein GOP47_0016891 [Adiantum capillus-veneris]
MMSLTKAKDPVFSYFGDVKHFRAYIRKEFYWSHMHDEVLLIIRRLEVKEIKSPDGFEAFFKVVF